MKSSCSTVVFCRNSTLSIAIVGTSAIITRRSAFATGALLFVVSRVVVE